MTLYSRLMAFVLLPFLLAGCASYQSHYTVMKADTSGGDERQVRLSWRTAEYPFWHWREDEATPIRMETQCSRRVWRLKDPQMEDACSTGSIAACGDPALDLDRNRNMLHSDERICMKVTDDKGSDRILELGDRIELSVQCHPRYTEIDMGDETANADYLRASVVPYNLRVRTAPLGSLTQRPPQLDERVCDTND